MSSNEEVNWTRSVNVDQRGGQIILESQSLTTDGFWEINDFIVSLDNTIKEGELGAALLEALAASETDVEPLAEGQRSTPQTKKILRIAGVRSWKEFYNGNRSVSVIQNDAGDLVELTPMRNLGRRDGIDYLVDLIIRVDKVDADSIGRALREALELAPVYNG
jgi:hypothetical protein